MSLRRYFLHDFFTAREFNELEKRRRRRFRRDQSQRRGDRERIDELEQDLARVAMLARGLAEACLTKGVLSREELAAALLEADLADGAEDQVLDPSVALPGEAQTADLPPLDEPPHGGRPKPP